MGSTCTFTRTHSVSPAVMFRFAVEANGIAQLTIHLPLFHVEGSLRVSGCVFGHLCWTFLEILAFSRVNSHRQLHSERCSSHRRWLYSSVRKQDSTFVCFSIAHRPCSRLRWACH